MRGGLDRVCVCVCGRESDGVVYLERNFMVNIAVDFGHSDPEYVPKP